MIDEYVPVKGYERFYLINRKGDIVRLRNKNGKKYCKLKPYKDKDGYLRVKLYDEFKKSIWIGVHKVVAMTFLDNPNNYNMVNHKNYIRDDNRIDNLEWCDAKYNVQWSINNYKGSNKKAVARIDKENNKVIYSNMSEAAKINNLSVSNICNCCKGKRKKTGGYKWEYVIEPKST